MEKIKPCPICGYAACKWLYRDNGNAECEVQETRDAMQHQNYIHCPNCGCYFYFPAHILAAGGFNQRHKVTSSVHAECDLTDKCGSCMHAKKVGTRANIICNVTGNFMARSHHRCKRNYEPKTEEMGNDVQSM